MVAISAVNVRSLPPPLSRAAGVSTHTVRTHPGLHPAPAQDGLSPAARRKPEALPLPPLTPPPASCWPRAGRAPTGDVPETSRSHPQTPARPQRRFRSTLTAGAHPSPPETFGLQDRFPAVQSGRMRRRGYVCAREKEPRSPFPECPAVRPKDAGLHFP